MAEFILKGNPPIASEKIELPNIAQLIFEPMFLNANIEEVYRFGTDFMRETIDNAPIKNDRKYINTTFMLQLVDENTRTIRNRFGYKDEWHIDGTHSPFEEDYRTHILLSDCNCMTEFLDNDVSVDISEDMSLDDFNLMMNVDKDRLGLVGKKMEPNVFHTFTNYPHRTSQPSKLEFRYIIRFLESDNMKTTELEKSYLQVSSVFKGLEATKSMERKHNGIMLYRR